MPGKELLKDVHLSAIPVIQLEAYPGSLKMRRGIRVQENSDKAMNFSEADPLQACNTSMLDPALNSNSTHISVSQL